MKRVVSSLRRALVVPVFLGGLLAIPAVVAVAPAQASVIFDFVCTGPANCRGDDQFGGYFEFSDAAVAARRFDGSAGNWLRFVFTSGSRVGLRWGLGSLIFPTRDEVSFVLTADRNRIMSINNDRDLGAFVTFSASGDIFSIDEGACQNVSCRVQDVGGTGQVTGQWVRRNPVVLSEPGTLALIGLGLVGIAALRRRQTAA